MRFTFIAALLFVITIVAFGVHRLSVRYRTLMQEGIDTSEAGKLLGLVIGGTLLLVGTFSGLIVMATAPTAGGIIAGVSLLIGVPLVLRAYAGNRPHGAFGMSGRTLDLGDIDAPPSKKPPSDAPPESAANGETDDELLPLASDTAITESPSADTTS